MPRSSIRSSSALAEIGAAPAGEFSAGPAPTYAISSFAAAMTTDLKPAGPIAAASSVTA